MSSAELRTRHPVLDSLFDEWRAGLGADWYAYRNHAYRVFNLAAALSPGTPDDVEKLAIAAAFHDVGIWLDGTWDYLEPSVRRATDFLQARSRSEWVAEVSAMIREHHRLRPVAGETDGLVEAFRRADWFEVCFGCLPSPWPRWFVAELYATFPRDGFHGRLLRLSWPWIRRHPLRPLPMMRF